MSRKISTVIAALSLLFSVTAAVSADISGHLNRLAGRIDRQARLIVKETDHYRHTPQYNCLVGDAQELSRLACHIRNLSRTGCDPAQVAADLTALNAAYSHLEVAFCQVEQNAASGFGHIHGSTNRIRRLLDSIVEDIHHMLDDVHSLRPVVYGPTLIEAPRPAVYGAPRYN